MDEEEVEEEDDHTLFEVERLLSLLDQFQFLLLPFLGHQVTLLLLLLGELLGFLLKRKRGRG